MSIKNIISRFLILAFAVCIAACNAGRRDTAQAGVVRPVELIVFAASSMTETLKEIARLYREKTPSVNIIFNFDSSGTLKTQIQQGAVSDIFISAGQVSVDQLDSAADPSVNREGLDFVLQGTRVNILGNRAVLAVPTGNPANIHSFQDLVYGLNNANLLFAMGNSDVPVGQYTQRILSYLGLDERALTAAGRISYGSNVKEITTQIAEASVSCGVIYATDAFSAGLTIVDYASDEMTGQVIYPAAVLKASRHTDEAKAFLAFLQTPAAMAVFEKAGFTAVR